MRIKDIIKVLARVIIIANLIMGIVMRNLLMANNCFAMMHLVYLIASMWLRKVVIQSVNLSIIMMIQPV